MHPVFQVSDPTPSSPFRYLASVRSQSFFLFLFPRKPKVYHHHHHHHNLRLEPKQNSQDGYTILPPDQRCFRASNATSSSGVQGPSYNTRYIRFASRDPGPDCFPPGPYSRGARCAVVLCESGFGGRKKSRCYTLATVLCWYNTVVGTQDWGFHTDCCGAGGGGDVAFFLGETVGGGCGVCGKC